MDGVIFFFKWEESFIAWLQQLGGEGVVHGILVALNEFFSFLGEEYIAIGVMGLIYWGIDKKKAERIGFAVLSSLVCNALVKNRFKRIRPWASSEKIELLRPVDGYSFPSAHSSSATALYPTLAHEYRQKKWLRIPAIVLPTVIAFSRCFLGAHWPTDVLTGLLMGLAFFAIAEFVLPRVKSKYIVYGIMMLIGFIGMFYCVTEDYFTNYGIFTGFCGAMLFDDKAVKFENTKKPVMIVLRTLGGMALFFVLNIAAKALFGLIFTGENFAAMLGRTLRYAIVVFVILGVYPAVFRPVEKFFEEKILKK